MAKSKESIEQKAAKVLEMANKRGVAQSYFFETTFKRYMMQISILERLEKAIDEHGELVEKEYVKGRKNIVTNPAIVEYNKTSTAANGTVSTLINIVKALTDETEDGGKLESMIAELHDDK